MLLIQLKEPLRQRRRSNVACMQKIHRIGTKVMAKKISLKRSTAMLGKNSGLRINSVIIKAKREGAEMTMETQDTILMTTQDVVT